MENLFEKKMITSEHLFYFVMEYKIKDASTTFIECLHEFMKLHNIDEVDTVVKLIDKNLKEKIEAECAELSLLKNSTKTAFSIL